MRNKLIAIAIAVLVIGGIIVGTMLLPGGDGTSNTTVSESTAVSGGITYADGGNSVTYTGTAGKTALVNLMALTDVETTVSDAGDMVTSINGTASVDGENYWAFYVNGEYANEGASTYITKDGDVMSWKLEDIK